MHPDPHALKLYVDGSALKNPGGPGGFAGVAEFPDRMDRPNEVVFEEGYLATTNNRMELLACIYGFNYVRRFAKSLDIQRAIIVTDSKYIHDNHRNAAYWKLNKWRNLDGRPIENVDLWNDFLRARAQVRVRLDIQWAKGKTSAILKEVDRHAKAAARQPTNVDRGFRGGKVGRSKTPTRSASTLFPAKGQEAVINIYRKQMAGKTERKIYFDLFAEDKKEFVAKYHAYTSIAMAVELHRGHCYRVRFNDNAKHPIIEEKIEEVSIA